MTLRYVHPGGYFWALMRSERDSTLLRIAAARRKMLVLASSESGAERLAERFTLSGVPVLLATSGGRPDAIEVYRSDDVSGLVTTQCHLEAHGPVAAPIVVHSRLAKSFRDYNRRRELAISPVHVSLVLPEDEEIAELRGDQIGSPVDLDLDLDTDDALEALLRADEHVAEPAMSSRRWFPLSR